MDDELKEFRDMFFEEAGENLQTLEAGLLHLESAGDDDELLNGVFRAAHSIKGGAASFGLTDVSGFAHVMEGLLDQIRRHERAITRDIASLLLRATDMLRGLMESARLETDPPPGVDALTAALEHARSQPHDGRDAVVTNEVADAAPASRLRLVGVGLTPAIVLHSAYNHLLLPPLTATLVLPATMWLSWLVTATPTHPTRYLPTTSAFEAMNGVLTEALRDI